MGSQAKAGKPKPARATGKRKCRGCGGLFGPEGMALNQVFCHRDKVALDALARLAKKQGKVEWLSEARLDEAKVQKLLAAYHDKVILSPQNDKAMCANRFASHNEHKAHPKFSISGYAFSHQIRDSSMDVDICAPPALSISRQIRFIDDWIWSSLGFFTLLS